MYLGVPNNYSGLGVGVCYFVVLLRVTTMALVTVIPTRLSGMVRTSQVTSKRVQVVACLSP